MPYMPLFPFAWGAGGLAPLPQEGPFYGRILRVQGQRVNSNVVRPPVVALGGIWSQNAQLDTTDDES